jgi:hypothetical protein
MKSLEIWTNHPESESKMLEKWEIKEGVAVPTYLAKEEPMYSKLGLVTPQDGEKFLKRLAATVDNASFLRAVVT